MKKWTAIAFVLLILFGCACAEDILKEEKFYSAPDDLCFHQHPACSGRSDLELIADTTGLFPCPVCADDPNPHEEPEAFAVGDIVIIRVPDKWMRERPDIDTIFASWDKECYADYEADAVIAKYLHGAEYRGFLNSDGFPIYAYIPDVASAMIYSCRHIGDSWYMVTRRKTTEPMQKSELDGHHAQQTENTWYGYLRFVGGRMWMQDGITCFYQPAEWREPDYSMHMEAMSETTIFEGVQNGYHVKLYAHEDFYLCVISGATAHENSKDMTMVIDGMPLTAEMVNVGADISLILTSSEVHKLTNGSEIKLIEGTYGIEDFMSSEYAIIESIFWSNYDRRKVIDKCGNVLLSDNFLDISRYGDVFFCEKRDKADSWSSAGVSVYDFTKSRDPLFFITRPDVSMSLRAAWEDAFVLSWYDKGDKTALYDMHTGEELRIIEEQYADMSYLYSFSGEYVFRNGKSKRICSFDGSSAYLMDNYANIVCEFENCEAILPLTWSRDNGLFLLIYGEDAWALPAYDDLFKHGFDAGDYYWYFGEFNYNDPWDEYEMSFEEYLDYMDSKISDIAFALVNENGEFVTDAPFTYIRVIDEKQVEIGNRDGMRMIVETER